MRSEISTGRVSAWHREEGWGVIESDDTPGGTFTHFSVIDEPAHQFHDLNVGEQVSFEWEAAAQDNFNFRASRVKRMTSPSSSHENRHVKARGEVGYQSSLEVNWDDNGTGQVHA
ncbi:cold-shock protein [Streptomyces carpaticus]|uniref:Cold-shock protein n=1 Tax=Streptomyces carpaticus TaxID=285558 RepID=A0ABV4ZQE9_9ACTN